MPRQSLLPSGVLFLSTGAPSERAGRSRHHHHYTLSPGNETWAWRHLIIIGHSQRPAKPRGDPGVFGMTALLSITGITDGPLELAVVRDQCWVDSP